MKTIIASLFVASFALAQTNAPAATATSKTVPASNAPKPTSDAKAKKGEEIVHFHTQRDDKKAMHWVSDKTSVKAGQKYSFEFKNDADKDPPFHGVSIPVLNVAKQVNFGETITVPVTVPANLKGKTLDIGCQFHPKHVHATLNVE